MGRESAIKFLRDIRLGVEYLQNAYANHEFTKPAPVPEVLLTQAQSANRDMHPNRVSCL